jgi:hypothetical protein
MEEADVRVVVQDALDSLPDWVSRELGEVAVVGEGTPTPTT